MFFLYGSVQTGDFVKRLELAADLTDTHNSLQFFITLFNNFCKKDELYKPSAVLSNVLQYPVAIAGKSRDYRARVREAHRLFRVR